MQDNNKRFKKHKTWCEKEWVSCNLGENETIWTRVLYKQGDGKVVGIVENWLVLWFMSDIVQRYLW